MGLDGIGVLGRDAFHLFLASFALTLGGQHLLLGPFLSRNQALVGGERFLPLRCCGMHALLCLCSLSICHGLQFVVLRLGVRQALQGVL
jgi:hypothetical protein